MNQVVIQAVDEVENPVILSTLAVIDTISFCTEKPGPSPRNGIFDGPGFFPLYFNDKFNKVFHPVGESKMAIFPRMSV